MSSASLNPAAVSPVYFCRLGFSNRGCSQQQNASFRLPLGFRVLDFFSASRSVSQSPLHFCRMLITGSLNTLTTKLADTTESEGIDGTKRDFNHPFTQALGMFFGECLCLITFRILILCSRRSGREVDTAKPFSPLIFVIPACETIDFPCCFSHNIEGCDMVSTSLMYAG